MCEGGIHAEKKNSQLFRPAMGGGGAAIMGSKIASVCWRSWSVDVTGHTWYQSTRWRCSCTQLAVTNVCQKPVWQWQTAANGRLNCPHCVMPELYTDRPSAGQPLPATVVPLHSITGVRDRPVTW